MKNIAIIDAETIGNKKHRFPNLCSMKISAYHKSLGDKVTLKLDYDNLEYFDKVYISKVFIKTEIPGEPEDKSNKNESTIIDWYKDNEFLNKPNIEYGGTGFFYDKAPPLSYEIEHIKPDYHLYDDWVNMKIENGSKRSEFTYYLDYSIGYLTRKCFRQCYYCVNKNYKGVEVASPLDEFMDQDRPKLCFLDDNFFGCPKWKELIKPVVESGKRFQFKQGLDERLLTKEKIIELSKWKYDGEVIFAFDNIEDKDLIISKLKLIRETVPEWTRGLKFYVFCGCDKSNKYNKSFWENDIRNLFERIYILSQFGALPYIMRFEKVYDSEYSSFYATVSAWCNQPFMFKALTFRLYSIKRGKSKIIEKGSTWRAMEKIEHQFPNIADKYYDFVGFSNKFT